MLSVSAALAKDESWHAARLALLTRGTHGSDSGYLLHCRCLPRVSNRQLLGSTSQPAMASNIKLPPLSDEMKPPQDPAAQQRSILGKAKRLAVRVLACQ